MEHIILLYFFFTGCVYTSYMWDLKENIWLKAITIILGFFFGWFATPLLIGRAIKRIRKD